MVDAGEDVVENPVEDAEVEAFDHAHVVELDVEAYITRQKEHHQRFDYQTEFLELLRRHGIEFDPNEVFQ